LGERVAAVVADVKIQREELRSADDDEGVNKRTAIMLFQIKPQKCIRNRLDRDNKTRSNGEIGLLLLLLLSVL
jgi:hypothetical protein